MLKMTGRHQKKGAKRAARVSWQEAAHLLASGIPESEVARRVGCSRTRLFRMMRHDRRLKALLTLLGERPGDESQALVRTRIRSRLRAK